MPTSNQTPLHSWGLSPAEAIALQKKLSTLLKIEDDFGEIRYLAGADISLNPKREEGYAGFVVFEFPSLKEIERVSHQGPLLMPYVPGLLSFREGPILAEAFQKLKTKPDLIVFDGHGIAHPRRMGIASHMGLFLDCPSIGCGKSRLWGNYEEPDVSRGSYSDLRDGNEKLGYVLRTKDKVKPVFISPGHRVSVESSLKIILQCLSGFRLPKPTREADRYVAEVKRELNEARPKH